MRYNRKILCRVFKKASSDGRITVYLGRRDFVDHVTGSDPIDGVVNIDRYAHRQLKAISFPTRKDDIV
jgi:hypothetical protein